MTLRTTAPTPKRRMVGQSAFRLLIVHGPDPSRVGQSVLLSKDPVGIGRGEGQALVLKDDEVSRQHAVVAKDPETKDRTLRDLDSRNGTFVNGEQVASARLRDGDVVRVGSHLLLVQELTAAECRQSLLGAGKETSLVGPSLRMQLVRAQIASSAALEVPVLVQGESGVGKELVAQELHRQSGSAGRFVAVNCAALPSHLVESELFGHASGAFTGATGSSEGLFGEASEGTLFLDEIGEMPLPVQPKLLRALATGEVRGVGQTRARHVRARVVAATNVVLDEAVDEGRFREDLYARLMGVSITIPPLRRRREDVLPLARHFLRLAGVSVEPTPDAAEALLTHGFRYNVRELEQTMRAVAQSARAVGELDLVHLPEELQRPFEERRLSALPFRASQAPIALKVRRDVPPSSSELEEVLRHFDGNVARVAEFFEKDRRQVYRWAERLDVDLSAFRDQDADEE